MHHSNTTNWAEGDHDPRKVVHAGLVDWLAARAPGVPRDELARVADAALDSVEDLLVGHGRDWAAPE